MSNSNSTTGDASRKIGTSIYLIDPSGSMRNIPRSARIFAITNDGYVFISTLWVARAILFACIDGAPLFPVENGTLVSSEWVIQTMPDQADAARILRNKIIAAHPDASYVPETADWRLVS